MASLIGDALLVSPSLFLPGLVAFLIAHGLYIAAFSRGVGFCRRALAVAAIGAFAGPCLRLCLAGRRAGLRIGVAVYAAVVACDAAQATATRDCAA